MINVNREALMMRIREESSISTEHWIEMTADRIIRDTDPRLEISVTQWIDGKDIEDVRFPAQNGKSYGIVQVMKGWKNRDFIGALDVMNDFFQNEERAIAQMRRFVM